MLESYFLELHAGFWKNLLTLPPVHGKSPYKKTINVVEFTQTQILEDTFPPSVRFTEIRLLQTQRSILGLFTFRD